MAEIFQRYDGLRQRVVAEALGFERARLDFVFGLPVQFADFVHDPFADGGMGAGDAGLAIVEIVLEPDFLGFKRGVFPVNAVGQLFCPFDGGLVRQPGGGGGLGAALAVQPFLARGTILDGALQRVQQRKHFLDAQVTHNFCSSKINENRPVRERVCKREFRLRTIPSKPPHFMRRQTGCNPKQTGQRGTACSQAGPRLPPRAI